MKCYIMADYRQKDTKRKEKERERNLSAYSPFSFPFLSLI